MPTQRRRERWHCTRHWQLSPPAWGPTAPEDAQYLRVNIRQLRRIEPDPAHPCRLLTEIGIDYRLVELPEA